VLPDTAVRRARGALARAVRFVTSPGAEWEAVRAEHPPVVRVLWQHLVPLSLLPAAGWAAGIAMAGRPGSIWVGGVATFLLCLASVVLHASALNAVLPMYGCRRDWGRACVVSSYAATPLLAVGVFLVLPALMVMALITLPFALYLVHDGVQRLLGVRQADAAEFVAVTATLFVIASMAAGAVLGGSGLI
jgi:hypothetical protein